MEPIQLQELKQLCDDFGITLNQAISEKSEELKLRLFLRCLPNDRIKTQQIASFLELVLGRKPSDDLVVAVLPKVRSTNITEDERIFLETKQNLRCALCGRYLSEALEPHVDHITPVALGGTSELSNFQLLCRQCNLGKGKLVGWILGAPYLREDRLQLSASLRYCVLRRDCGTCTMSECGTTALHSEMLVEPVIPVSSGGRMIFDNLGTVCIECFDIRQRKRKQGFRIQLSNLGLRRLKRYR